ncbi:ssDNA-binding protein [Achromobacter aegrifaciens]
MADKKSPVKVVFKGRTPAGIAAWAWVDKPDNSEYGKGKFKCALKLEKGVEANDTFARKLIDLHKAAKGKKDTCPVKDGDAMAEDNEKRENMRGFWVLTAKSKNKPDQVDAKKQPLKATAKSGDLVKLSIAAAEFDTGANKGVTLYLNALQLLERRAASATDDFEDEDDYEGDSARAETPDTRDDDQADSTPDDDDDF